MFMVLISWSWLPLGQQSCVDLMCVWQCIVDMNKVDDQLNVTIIIYWSSNYLSNVSGNSLPILRSARPWFITCPIMSPDCCRLEARCVAAWTMCSCRHTPGLRPTTFWGHYTTYCKSQSCAPQDGQRIAQNIAEVIWRSRNCYCYM